MHAKLRVREHFRKSRRLLLLEVLIRVLRWSRTCRRDQFLEGNGFGDCKLLKSKAEILKKPAHLPASGRTIASTNGYGSLRSFAVTAGT